MSCDLLIRDVRAVLPEGLRHVDIEVVDGKISNIRSAGAGGLARAIVEGGGREAFPGIIDPHVHFRSDPKVGVDADSFQDMAQAAARGGMTAVIAYITAPRESIGLESVEPYRSQPQDVPVDYGLHHVLWPHEHNLTALDELSDVGIRSFKMFMAYPERGFMFEGEMSIRALERVAELGGLMLVHCEEGNSIRWIERRMRLVRGKSATITDYIESRPERLEATAVQLVGLWASLVRCPLYLVHISTAKGLQAGAELIQGGDVTLETCPQYLTLDSSALERLGPLAKFAPVLRPPVNREALWEAVADGTIRVIGSDHAAHSGSEKIRIAGASGIFDVPFGAPGVETLFPVLYTLGVCGGRLTHQKLAGVTSTNAARRFGWYPRKGAIRIDSDADLVLIDPGEKRAVRANEMRSRAGYSLYEGIVLQGWPSTTILRGQVTFDAGQLQSAPGQFHATRPRKQEPV